MSAKRIIVDKGERGSLQVRKPSTDDGRTVRELIALLKHCPPDATVYAASHCCISGVRSLDLEPDGTVTIVRNSE